MMSMQGPSSLSNACTSITVLLERGEGEDEFSTQASQSRSPRNLFLNMSILLCLRNQTTGYWTLEKDGVMWRQHPFSLVPHTALDTSLHLCFFHTGWGLLCPSHSQAIVSAHECLPKEHIHPFLVGHTTMLQMWELAGVSQGVLMGKKILHIRKKS